MREAAKMVRAAGLEPTMASAKAELQDWVASLDVGSAVKSGDAARPALVDASRRRADSGE